MMWQRQILQHRCMRHGLFNQKFYVFRRTVSDHSTGPQPRSVAVNAKCVFRTCGDDL